MLYEGEVEIQVKGACFQMSDIEKNSKLARPDEYYSGLEWPRLTRENIPQLDENDRLILCAGFEKRSVEVLRRLVGRDGRSKFSVCMIKYLPKKKENRIEQLRAMCRKNDIDVLEFTYNREEPPDISDEMSTFAEGCQRLFVDISGMSRLLIVQMVVALAPKFGNSLRFLYCEARRYPPSRWRYMLDREQGGSTTQLSYLSTGIYEIATTPEISSVSMLGEAIRLIAFPSFDPAQLRNLVQELQPTYSECIHGRPPYIVNRWRMKAVKELNGRTLAELKNNTDHIASTLDYRQTLRILFGVYRERSMFDRIVVSPTGSKMQSVAVGMFRTLFPDVQVVYPTPQEFLQPRRYTVGIGRLHVLRLPGVVMNFG